MNIYFGPKDKEIVDRVNQEAKKRRRSVSYIIKDFLRKAYGIKNGGD